MTAAMESGKQNDSDLWRTSSWGRLLRGGTISLRRADEARHGRAFQAGTASAKALRLERDSTSPRSTKKTSAATAKERGQRGGRG